MITHQYKSKERIDDHGEVFTSHREVNDMLDLVFHESERIESRFLEPACGNGNFLVEILKRKLEIVRLRYGSLQNEWEWYSTIAISSLYGVDILEDNAIECRSRLFSEFQKQYHDLFKSKSKMELNRVVKFLIDRNILWGDALDFTNPSTKKPLIFSEWSALSGGIFKRRDFVFRFLVEQSHQFSMFNDEGREGMIDEPVKDFPLAHFLNLDGYDCGNI